MLEQLYQPNTRSRCCLPAIRLLRDILERSTHPRAGRLRTNGYKGCGFVMVHTRSGRETPGSITAGETPTMNNESTGEPSQGESAETATPLDTYLRRADETAVQHNARLRVAIEEREAEQLNEILLQQATGLLPIRGIEAAGAHESHKRTASSTLAQDRLKHLKLSNAPEYDGKSTRKLDEFDLRWKTIFDAPLPGGPLPQEERVRIAATSLREHALLRWRTAFEAGETASWDWNQFVSYMRDGVVDPANRMSNIRLRLKDLKQKEGQSVQNVLQTLMSLESELPRELDPKEQAAWVLLDCYKPEIRNAVLRDLPAPKDRAQVAEVALRHEGFMKDATQQVHRSSPSMSARPLRNVGGSRESTPSKARVFQRREEQGRVKTTSGESRVCYNCGKSGHVARECRSRQKSTKDAGDSQAKKGPPTH